MAEQKPQSLLQKLENQRSILKLNKLSSSSQKWFIDKIRSLGTSGSGLWSRVYKDQAARNLVLERNPGIGYMYMFAYFAKWDAKLPYWDRYPLIFVIEQYKDGFLGVNLHYLPPRVRALILDRLMSYVLNKTMTTKTKVKLSYDLLKSVAALKPLQPCIKRYLYPFLRSKVAKIPYTEWEAAIYLPTESFVRASKSRVWSDSLRNK